MTDASKGPWRLGRRVPAGPSDPGNHAIEISAQRWGCFARVVVQMQGEDKVNREGMANAHMIAAARDLYDAAHQAKRVLADMGQQDIELYPAFQALVSAIDKADGGNG